ncbi:MAG: hypothetical protein U5R14_06580 [Gemmatimonadota bacterium]|nr:hypothetical protein [Gemmatimonadota bacterium]
MAVTDDSERRWWFYSLIGAAGGAGVGLAAARYVINDPSNAVIEHPMLFYGSYALSGAGGGGLVGSALGIVKTR